MASAAMVAAAEVDEQLMQSEEDPEYEVAVARAGRNVARSGVMLLMLVATLLAALLATLLAAPAPTAAITSAVVLAVRADEEGDQQKDAPVPCKMEHADDKPSLFCWSVMYDSDKDLIKSQFMGRAGIFACNDFLVIAQEEMSIGKDDCGVERKTVQKKLPKVEKGMYGVNAMTSSWLNVPIFLTCWDVVIASNKVWENDFTVKLDPDTVFFPGRLGYHLKEHKGKPVYTTDCRYWAGDEVGNLFGSIEVLSKEAVGAYKGKTQTCKDLDWQGWGEDYWLQHCMDAIGVGSLIIADWVTDQTCPLVTADCSDSNLIAVHPKKDAGEWWECWKQSSPEE